MNSAIDTQRLAAARADRRALSGCRSQDDAHGQEHGVVVFADDTLLDTLGELRWVLGGMLESGPSRLVLDVSRVTRPSSTMIALLLWVKKRCRPRGVQIVVRRPLSRSLDVLRRTGLPSTPATDRRGPRAATPEGVGRKRAVQA